MGVRGGATKYCFSRLAEGGGVAGHGTLAAEGGGTAGPGTLASSRWAFSGRSGSGVAFFLVHEHTIRSNGMALDGNVSWGVTDIIFKCKYIIF